MNELEQLVKTTLTELKQLANTQSVVGEPIQAGNTTIIPLVKIGFGFGAGGGTGTKSGNNGTGGGTGAGAGVSPVAVLVVTEGDVRLESLSGNVGGGESPSSTTDKVLDLIKIALDKRKNKATEETDADPEETETAPDSE